VNGKNPRQIALGILQARRPNGEFTETLLERALAPAPQNRTPTVREGNTAAVLRRDRQAPKLSPADRGLCQELVYGIVRAQTTLDWLIARKTGGRQQNARLQDVLRLGLYQIFWLDRIPAHAAVHETVELARREGLGPKTGFVNAVLRGYLREFDNTKKTLIELKTADPAVGYSHPLWLVEKWKKHFGPENTRLLLEWNNTPPKTFARVNTLKAGPGKLLEKWRDENVEYDFVRRDFLQSPDRKGGGQQSPDPLSAVASAKTDEGADYQSRDPKQSEYNPEAIIFELKSHPHLPSMESFRDGWFYIQDPSTLLAPLELAPKAGEMVLDLCAAPGGKTTFIAQLMGNIGKIIAADISEERLKLLKENCDRLGVTSVHPTVLSTIPHSAFRIPHSNAGGRSTDFFIAENAQFDRILIDAPCSNTGVLRRRVDLRWRISPEELLRLQKTQLDLLKLAATKLKPGGVLIYSTCSLEPEENSSVIESFLREHQQFKLESERELLPFKDNVDGAFVARLKRIN